MMMIIRWCGVGGGGGVESGGWFVHIVDGI